MPGRHHPQATGKYCRASGVGNSISSVWAPLLFSEIGFAVGICAIPSSAAAPRYARQNPQQVLSCTNAVCSRGVARWAKGTVSGIRLFSLLCAAHGSHPNAGPLWSSGQALPIPAFQAPGIAAAAAVPVSCQKKACWVQVPVHPACTPSLPCHGHASVSAINPEPCLHLPFPHRQLLPYDIAQVWTLA